LIVDSRRPLKLVDGDAAPDDLVLFSTAGPLDPSGAVDLGVVGLDSGDPGLDEHLSLDALHLRQPSLTQRA
jgi:hypothetical protein